MLDAAMIKNKKVLVVEDDLPSQSFMKIILEDMGLVVTIAATGEEAIQTLKKDRYDLVFMDIRMPGMNGFDATRIIRTEISPTVPVIAVSAHALEWSPEKCFQIGMNDFVFKPVGADRIRSMVMAYIGKGQSPATVS